MPSAICPKCGLPGTLIWESEDKKTIAVRCPRYHSHLTPKPTKFKSYNNEKTKKNTVFLIDVS